MTKGSLPKVYTVIQFMIIIMLHLGMAVRSKVHTINVVCFSVINKISLNVVAVIMQSI